MTLHRNLTYVLGASLAFAVPLRAESPSLSVFPEKIALNAADQSVQLIVTGNYLDGRRTDMTGDVRYELTGPAIASVTSSGRVTPIANGSATIAIWSGASQVTVPVEVRDLGKDRAINFANQVVPIFTKIGCNAGACHGKQSGQNGFRLSLLGFEPELDYASLVKESRGRRTYAAAPEHSLLLLKATGSIPHGGGRKLDPASDDYKVVLRWISAGLQFGESSDPRVTGIRIEPDARTLSRQGRQQLAVIAEYSDGHTEDVTRRTQFDSNDLELATVDATGLVRTLGLSGQAAIMARYQGRVAVFRGTVPRGEAPKPYDFPATTVIDRNIVAQWQRLGLRPSELCSDEQFVRRACLDITGTLPGAKRVRDFVADGDSQKRTKLIDALLETPEYANHFANKWADVLRVKRRQDPNRAAGTFAFHDWIRDAIAADMPFDQFVRAILTATGDETRNPPVVWYKEVQTPEQFVDDVSQVFLGQRVACAQCHHHPYERWSQDDFWSMAAFFGKVGRKARPIPGVMQNQQRPPQEIYIRSDGTVTNRKANRPAAIKPLDGEVVTVARDEDPRPKLVDWMVDAKNPFFARAIANRYWAHFFSRGIVEPLDDMRVTNPPTNPELLDSLAASFTDSKFSLKSLVRTICTSRAYQLSSLPDEGNADDKQNYARFYPKRLLAEVMVDAVSHATGSPTTFAGLPRDRHAPKRALELPDESFASYFLDVFGRPQRITACECERVSEANLAQVLHLLNSDEVQGKLSRPDGRAERLSRYLISDDERIDELFLQVMSRRPTEKERETAHAQLEKHAGNHKQAYENLIWALINTKEFLFIQ